jgi:hypothetical protein
MDSMQDYLRFSDALDQDLVAGGNVEKVWE